MPEQDSGLTRLVVCFDLPGDTLADAYTNLRRQLQEVTVGWETSDEWYDKEGRPGDALELQQAACVVLQREQAIIELLPDGDQLHALRCPVCGARSDTDHFSYTERVSIFRTIRDVWQTPGQPSFTLRIRNEEEIDSESSRGEGLCCRNCGQLLQLPEGCLLDFG